MKQLCIALLLLAGTFYSRAEAIKVTVCSAAFSQTSSGSSQHEMGAPSTTIAQKEFGGAVVYFKVDVVNAQAVKAKYRLELYVTQHINGRDDYAYSQQFFIPEKNGWFNLYAEFKEGNYTVVVRDKENEADIYSTENFTVAEKPKVDYKNNSTLVVCTTVDDNWMPVGQTATVKKDACMNFLYKAKDRMNYGFLIWLVVKVKADGTEEYVNDLLQALSGNPFRYTCTTEGVCAFKDTGKYRIYLYAKDEFDASHGGNENYLGKTEILVQ